jgi:Zn finger protein HypA/HybF involved in hydrogenase expression
MRRKSIASSEPVISPAILEQAKRLLETERPKLLAKCSVCGAECAPNSSEQLCWVCRRLKISAWRESDQQPAAQE